MLLRTITTILFFLSSLAANSQAKITLRKSLIDSFKNKVTIKSDYAIFYAHKRANSAVKDGDLHFSGYDKKIGLPTVAEVISAKEETEAVAHIHENEGKGEPTNTVKLTGVWRLWAEHYSKGVNYIQGMGSDEIKNTNPHHFFEIHPITKIDDIDLTGSFRRVKGFKPIPAKRAFKLYQNLSCTITSNTKFITVETKKSVFNYADFWISLNTTDKDEVTDGLFVNCTVLDSKFKPGIDNVTGKTINNDIRMVFVKDTDPYNTVKSMKKGEFLHVTGIPRFNLKIIGKRVDDDTDLTGKLPFEMIIVAIIH